MTALCGVTCLLVLKTQTLIFTCLFFQGIFSIRQVFLTILIDVADVNVLQSSKEVTDIGAFTTLCVYPSASPLHH